MDPAGYAAYQQQYYAYMQHAAQYNPQYAMQLQQYYGGGPHGGPPGQPGPFQGQGGPAPPQFQQPYHHPGYGHPPQQQGYQVIRSFKNISSQNICLYRSRLRSKLIMEENLN